MTRVVARGRIDAPREIVFRLVSDVERLAKTSPDVIEIVFLTEQRSGLGTRFRETRRTGRKEMVCELEVTEFRENERSRMVTEVHGTVWDTVYSLRDADGGTELEICMDARPSSFPQRFMIPLMKGFFRRAMQTHLEQVRDRCEGEARRSASTTTPTEA